MFCDPEVNKAAYRSNETPDFCYPMGKNAEKKAGVIWGSRCDGTDGVPTAWLPPEVPENLAVGKPVGKPLGYSASSTAFYSRRDWSGEYDVSIEGPGQAQSPQLRGKTLTNSACRRHRMASLARVVFHRNHNSSLRA